MTLPTSGPLSLNDIKGEFGGPTSPSLGDYYAGGAYVPPGTTGTYGAVPSTGTISIQNFYGTSAVITETQTVTVGNFTFKGLTQWGFAAAFGSISDGTFGFISNAPITSLSWLSTGSQLTFQIDGLYSNAGWAKVTISGTDFLRSAASFSTSTGPDRTTWVWSSVSNPFGTTVGASVPAVFTQ